MQLTVDRSRGLRDAEGYVGSVGNGGYACDDMPKIEISIEYLCVGESGPRIRY